MQQAWSAMLTVSADTVKLAAAAGSSGSFSVTSNTAWNVLSDQLWLTVNPGTGTGNGKVTVLASANPTAAIRKATVMVTAAGVADQKVSVEQAGVATAVRNEMTGSVQVAVYPNPFAEGIYIQNIHTRYHVEITDARGRVVCRQLLSGDGYLPLGKITDGFYLVKIFNEEEMTVKKLIKQSR